MTNLLGQECIMFYRIIAVGTAENTAINLDQTPQKQNRNTEF